MNKFALIAQENENLKRELAHTKTQAEAKGAANEECTVWIVEEAVCVF